MALVLLQVLIAVGVLAIWRWRRDLIVPLLKLLAAVAIAAAIGAALGYFAIATHFVPGDPAATSIGVGFTFGILGLIGFGFRFAVAVLRPASSIEHSRTVAELPPQRHQGHQAQSDIFISYKREDRARVEHIAQALRDLKLSVWFDARLQSGKSFDDEINREVRGAKAVLVCWSRGAVDSEWVRAEASIGRQRGVLAACFLEACDPYPPFNLVHAEDLSAGSLDASNPGWLKIVEQIGRFVGRPGLGEYLQIGTDRSRAGAWLADNADDPLADAVMARLRA